MPIIHYPDNFKIEVVKHYKMHHNIDATLEKFGIARSTLFKWKKKYEENHFFRVSKKPANTGHKAQSHLDKLNKIVAASKELKCGVTSSITEKVAEIKRLEGNYVKVKDQYMFVCGNRLVFKEDFIIRHLQHH